MSWAAILEWMQGGNLSLGFSEADAADFEQWGRDARERGLETEIFTRGQVVEILPRLGRPLDERPACAQRRPG